MDPLGSPGNCCWCSRLWWEIYINIYSTLLSRLSHWRQLCCLLWHQLIGYVPCQLTDWLTGWLRSPLVSWKTRRSQKSLSKCSSDNPSSFLLPSYRRLWLVTEDYGLITNTAERVEREGRSETTVRLLLSHDASTHVRAGSASHRAVSMDTPALGCINKTHWYSDYLHGKKIQREIGSTSLQQTTELNLWRQKKTCSVQRKTMKENCSFESCCGCSSNTCWNL